MDASRRRFLTSAAALSLAGCGGGGSGSTQYIGSPPAAYRPGILYGYFGDDLLVQSKETADHASLYWSADWNGGVAGAVANILAAKGRGFRDLVVSCTPSLDTPEKTIDEVNEYMAELTGFGALEDMTLRGLVWCDEPNGDHPISDAFLRAVNFGLHVISPSTPLWVIYADRPDLPALDAGDEPRGAFDRVALDNYDIGCNVLGGRYDDLKRRMKPGARRFLVPGPVGGHFQQTDPTCFENFAYANPDIESIVPFIWFDGWANDPTHLGIRSFPAIAENYRALGKRLTGRV